MKNNDTNTQNIVIQQLMEVYLCRQFRYNIGSIPGN